MDFMSVLVPVSGTEADAAAVAAAIRVAHESGGIVRALYASGEPIEAAQFRYPSLGDSFFTEMEAAVREGSAAREARARAYFEDQAARLWKEIAGDGAGRQRTQWLSVAADEPDAILYQGGVYDLLVLGKAGRDDPHVVEAALFRTRRPVLFVPEAAPPRIGARVTIGWNRSAESGRAVAGALPLLQRAERVVICAIRTAAKRGPSPDELAEYLSHHRVTAEIVELDPQRRPIGGVLLDEARKQTSDLVVAGANYRSRLNETTPGGVTGYLLQKARLPVMMSH
jgi:nucleotide-binding universal stress UspA family protein